MADGFDEYDDSNRFLIPSFLLDDAKRLEKAEGPHPEGCGCPGWGVYNGREIQRCDECERFADDLHAAGWVFVNLANPHMWDGS